MTLTLPGRLCSDQRSAGRVQVAWKRRAGVSPTIICYTLLLNNFRIREAQPSTSNWRVIVPNVAGSPRAPNVDQFPAPFISAISPVIIEDTSLPILQSVYRV